MPTIQVRKTSKGEKRYTAQVRLDGCPHVSATFPNRKDAKDTEKTQESSLNLLSLALSASYGGLQTD